MAERKELTDQGVKTPIITICYDIVCTDLDWAFCRTSYPSIHYIDDIMPIRQDKQEAANMLESDMTCAPQGRG